MQFRENHSNELFFKRFASISNDQPIWTAKSTGYAAHAVFASLFMEIGDSNPWNFSLDRRFRVVLFAWLASGQVLAAYKGCSFTNPIVRYTTLRRIRMNKLFLLGIAFALVLSLGLMIACGDDDDDDNDTAGDDDDDTSAPTCESVYTAMDDCGIALQDAEGNEIPVEDVIAGCEAGDPADYALDGAIAGCILDNLDDCDAMLTCIAELF
jgi:hypothetical protein